MAPKTAVRSRGTETVLLVEDEAAVRRIVGEMLLRLGYTILEAPDGRSAQKFVQEYDKPIQLLLTDVVMPEMGGRELAKRLKAHTRGSESAVHVRAMPTTRSYSRACSSRARRICKSRSRRTALGEDPRSAGRGVSCYFGFN